MLESSARSHRQVGRFTLLAFAAVVPLLTAAAADAAPHPSNGATAVRVRVTAAPSPVLMTDGLRHLVYEITAENATRTPVHLDQIQTLDPARRTVLATHRGRSAADLMAGLQGRPTARLAPGRADVLLLDVALRPGQPTPKRLAHRFTWTIVTEGKPPRPVSVAGARTPVARTEPVRLSPPLRGASFGVIGCCSSTSAHRRAVVDQGRRLLFPQRYAVDVVQLDDAFGTFSGDPRQNAGYFVYGDDVIAAAPGRVLGTRDGVAENVPPNTAPNVTAAGATGNMVQQDLGGGRFAIYAHLQPGSVQVRPGELVRRGQVLGRIGNSGNSFEPHLHFQVADAPGGPSGMIADGVPFTFSHFSLDGQVTGLDTDPPTPARAPTGPPQPRRDQYPRTGDVLAFDAGGTATRSDRLRRP